MNIFNGLEQEESLWLIGFHVVAFLIGLFTGWMIWSSAARRLKKENKSLKATNKDLTSLNGNLVSTTEIQTADKRKLELEMNRLSAQIKGIETQKGDLHTELFKLKESETALKEVIDDLKGELAEAKSTGLVVGSANLDSTEDDGDDEVIAALKERVIALQDRNDSLELELDKVIFESRNAVNEEAEQLQSKVNELNVKHEEKETSILDIEAQLGELQSSQKELYLTRETEVADLKHQIASLQESLTHAQNNNTTLESDISDKENKANLLLSEVARLKALNDAASKEEESSNNLLATLLSNGDDDEVVTALKERVVALQDEKDHLELEMDKLVFESRNAVNEEAEHLQSKVNELQVKEVEKQSSITDMETQLEELQSNQNELRLRRETEVGDLKSQLQSLYESLVHAQNNIAILEKDISNKDDKANELLSELAKIKAISTVSAATLIDETASVPVVEVNSNEGEEIKQDVKEATREIKAMLGNRITKASYYERDSLKTINGIGGFIEKKLNALGIYNFEQISQFDDEVIEKITTAIEFFPERIKDDDWVGQAKKLLVVE